jgi:hypothetical protein
VSEASGIPGGSVVNSPCHNVPLTASYHAFVLVAEPMLVLDRSAATLYVTRRAGLGNLVDNRYRRSNRWKTRRSSLNEMSGDNQLGSDSYADRCNHLPAEARLTLRDDVEDRAPSPAIFRNRSQTPL